MKWLLARLIFNAIVFVWRLLVTMPEMKMKAGRRLLREKQTPVIIDRA
jgi:hypothetical protein